MQNKQLLDDIQKKCVQNKKIQRKIFWSLKKLKQNQRDILNREKECKIAPSKIPKNINDEIKTKIYNQNIINAHELTNPFDFTITYSKKHIVNEQNLISNTNKLHFKDHDKFYSSIFRKKDLQNKSSKNKGRFELLTSPKILSKIDKKIDLDNHKNMFNKYNGHLKTL